MFHLYVEKQRFFQRLPRITYRTTACLWVIKIRETFHRKYGILFILWTQPYTIKLRLRHVFFIVLDEHFDQSIITYVRSIEILSYEPCLDNWFSRKCLANRRCFCNFLEYFISFQYLPSCFELRIILLFEKQHWTFSSEVDSISRDLFFILTFIVFTFFIMIPNSSANQIIHVLTSLF